MTVFLFENSVLRNWWVRKIIAEVLAQKPEF